MNTARCYHTQHKRSSVPYRIQKDRKEVTNVVPVVLGYNSIHHRYELCDEGFAPKTHPIKTRDYKTED